MTTRTEALHVVVNGAPRELSPGATLPDLLRQMDIDPETAQGIAVAMEEEVIPRSRWAETTLSEGDRVEVITAQQGG